jgi:hypothetical protein
MSLEPEPTADGHQRHEASSAYHERPARPAGTSASGADDLDSFLERLGRKILAEQQAMDALLIRLRRAAG